jgi:hypothetical protein
LNYAFFVGSCDHRGERATIERSNGHLRCSNHLIRSAGGPSDPGVFGVSTVRLNLPNAIVDTQRREIDKLRYRIQVLAGRGYLRRLASEQDLDTALKDIEREFEDLRDLLVVSECAKQYII